MSCESNPVKNKKRGNVHPIKRSREGEIPPAIPPWVQELEKWEQSEYDGLKGFPPEWVPTPHKKQFVSKRGVLFHLIVEQKATYAEIRARFAYLLNEKYASHVLALSKDTKPYDDVLTTLVHIYKAVRLGVKEGLLQLAGETAVTGYQVRTAHLKRTARAAKAMVQQIGKEKWAANPRLTIKDIISSPELNPFTVTDKTKREWLSEVDSRPASSKQGRPSRHR